MGPVCDSDHREPMAGLGKGPAPEVGAKTEKVHVRKPLSLSPDWCDLRKCGLTSVILFKYY